MLFDTPVIMKHYYTPDFDYGFDPVATVVYVYVCVFVCERKRERERERERAHEKDQTPHRSKS